jgi:hypothetical protein
MKTHLLTVLVFLLTGTVVAAQTVDHKPHTWNNGIGHSAWELGLDPKDQKLLLELWDSIGKDLETNTHQLAGTYVKGGYEWGYFLRWSPNKGFIVIPYFDQNLITDFGYGKVSIADESDVIFTSERQLKGGRGLARMPERWTAILGYLVPVERLAAFGQFRAGLGDYNNFNGSCCEFRPDFLCSKIDPAENSVPTLIPPKYAHFFQSPITAQITSVGGRKTVRDWRYDGVLYREWMEKAVLIPVTINAGRRNGVKPNMLFRLIGAPDFEQYLQIVRVNTRTSYGYVVRDVSFEQQEKYYDDETKVEKPLPPIRIGIRVTTSPRQL